MTTSKVRIKIGPIEVDFEGSESFLKDELPDLLEAVSKLYKETGVVDALPDVGAVKIKEQDSGTEINTGSNMTVSSIAAKMNCKTGPDLVLAAMLKLAISGVQNVSRKRLNEEMKAATGFYKTTYTSNLGSSLTNLIKTDAIRETAKETYTLSVKKRQELEQKVAA